MKISVITVNYNDGSGLRRTLDSFKDQIDCDKELIVIDGASSDNSLQVIKDNLKLITTWISEKDEGIYYAMNKGIDLAKGDFAIFMNSGDVFYSNEILKTFSNGVSDYNKAYFGRAEIYADEFNEWYYPNLKFDKGNINKWLNNNLPNHQAIFFPKSFYKNEKYDLKYKISSDADYKFRAMKLCGFSFVDFVICRFYIGGVSSSFSNFKKTRSIVNESKQIMSKHKSKKEAYLRITKIYVKYFISSFGAKYFNLILNLYRK